MSLPHLEEMEMCLGLLEHEAGQTQTLYGTSESVERLNRPVQVYDKEREREMKSCKIEGF
jgi:hypothetical protein